MSIAIYVKGSDAPIAQGDTDNDVAKYEGNWYFQPSAVDQKSLVTTDRTYTCPSKGTCHWVDFRSHEGTTTPDVAWIYANPKPGHEIIGGRYGFYAGTRGATRQE